MPVTRRWDVVVAGAGPAGAATAAFLAEAGCRTLLIDRARFPREKPCSDYVAPGARSVLAKLGVLGALEQRGEPVHGMEVTSPSGTTLRGDYRGGSGFGMPRRELDAQLVELAVARGATLWEETRAEGLTVTLRGAPALRARHAGHTHTLSARVVVGADGLRSAIARALGGGTRVGPRRLALVAQIADVEGLHGVGEIFVAGGGYVGVAPLPGGAANVAVVQPAARAHRGMSGSALFWTELAHHPDLHSRVRDRPVLRGVLATGPFGWRSQRAVGNGVILVGDAAHFFDPLTGDGVAAALHGAALAAQVILQALGRLDVPTRRALAPYETMHRRLFGGRWSAQRLLGAAVAHPRLFDLGLRALTQRRELGDRIVQFAGSVAPVSSLFQPLATNPRPA
jgi:geranylgeranyl reductase family protein